jgi:hypothetical protein
MSEGMTVGDMQIAGWQVDTLVKVSWKNDGQAVSIPLTPGSLAQVVPGRRYVAIIMKTDGPMTRLLIYDERGKLHIELPSTQTVNDKQEEVTYSWFETDARASDDTFVVAVFLPRGVTYNLLVNVTNGVVQQVGESR